MDLLSDILSQMRLSGTLYFRTSFTSPWSIQVPAYQDVARFHFAWKGRCLVRVADAASPVMLEQGDLIIIPRGATHTLYCDPKTEREAMQLDQVIDWIDRQLMTPLQPGRTSRFDTLPKRFAASGGGASHPD